ncbi:hypothetical protein [Falsirhodobacter xinxiangensis]|uniref:hypothetical protein n=1 Tax=Falsirhodobacter xinxiangensis TaxID=2530049 RepID=UPI0010AABB95|nr:hypothetical protein [Rhodobacter xinxiangensis]
MTDRHLPFALIGATAVGFGIGLWACDARADGTPTPFEQVQGLMCPPPVMTLAERAPGWWFGERPTYGAYTPDPRRGLVSVPERPIGGGGGSELPPEHPTPVPLPAAGWLLGGALIGGAAMGLYRTRKKR